MVKVRQSQFWAARFAMPSIIIFIAGTALLVGSLYFDGPSLLRLVGFPADRLYHPRVLGDLAIVRFLSGLVATILMISQVILWKHPGAGLTFYTKVKALISAAETATWAPLVLVTLVSMKTVLQLGLFFVGYTLYEADDFARALRADYLVQFHKLDPGWDLGYLALVSGSGQLPFSEYLFGFGLALYRDPFLTPKIVNLIVSAAAVIVVYFLGRELFGRMAGLITAALFAFLPWTVWLGISGMPSDLPSVLFISLFGLFLFRWLETDKPAALLTAAGCLFVANAFRYENWFFSITFSVLIVLTVALLWRGGRLQRRIIFSSICALTIINAFPVFWMAFSYYTSGDWLPEYKSAAFMISPDTTSPRVSSISIPVLALGSFPFELVASIAGVALFLKSDRRKPFRIYLLVLAATFLMFSTMVRWQLPAYGGIARYLLAYMTLLLPYAGFLVTRLLNTPASGWNGRVVLTSAFVLALVTFDIARAFNYPGIKFPKDALYAGWTLRGLQETGTIQKDARILIERAADWGDLGIVVLANRPERFVVLNELAYIQAGLLGDETNKPAPVALSGSEGVRGNACDKGFQAEACRKSLRKERFDIVILSSPDRVQSFRETFHTRSWNIGRYHIFDLQSSDQFGDSTHINDSANGQR